MFEIEGGLPLALTRALSVAALLSAFGGLVFTVVVLPKVVQRVSDAADCEAPLANLVRRSLICALVFLPCWGLLQTVDLLGAWTGLRPVVAAVPDVLAGTLFGHVLLAQFVAVLLALWAVRGRRPKTALALAAAALLMQAGHSHALSMTGGPSVLLASDGLHLLAAGAWLGGLLPLLVVVRGTTPRTAALAARWFSPLGKLCVIGLVLSAGFQFWVLVGGLPGLVGTPYGWIASGKLALLGVLFAFAVANRYRLAPALLHDPSGTAGHHLIRAIAVQTGFGLLTVLAAGVLSELPPAVHEQPNWPFPWRPSLAVMGDPDLAFEVWTGAALLAVSGGMLLSLLWLPMRQREPILCAMVGSAVVACLAMPHLTPLLVEAYPTSYYTSPSSFAASSIRQGLSLYPQHCARCHGPLGRGDGPDAKALPVPPADLTVAHLWEHADGELFWWLSHGVEAPDGTLAMPGFAGVLSDGERWALIDAVRARNAGLALQTGGVWPASMQLPDFGLTCPGQGALTINDLRGRVLYLVFGLTSARPELDVLPIFPGKVIQADPLSACATTDPAAWNALAVITGQTSAELLGSRLLVDSDGWLRAFRPAASAAEWDEPGAFSAAVRTIIDTPLTITQAGAHQHH